MDSHILKHKKGGFTLLEVTAGIGLMAILILAVITASQGVYYQSKVNRTVNDMFAISEACRQFYKRNNSWPISLSVLKPDFLTDSVLDNPFSYPYLISPVEKSILISSEVEKGAWNSILMGTEVVITDNGTTNLISLSQPIPLGNAGWILYDKQHNFNQ